MTTDPLAHRSMIRIPDTVFDQVTAGYGRYFERVSKVPARKLASDVLNPEKVHDQVALLCQSLGIGVESLRGKRVLEVGSGFGVFVAVTRAEYGMESFGLEPAASGFDSSYHTSRELIRENGLDPEVIANARGEAIPFPDDHFDFVFSSTALEHTENPERVLGESLRVLKPGGGLHFVFPNYGSFFEGHYALPWIPYLPHFLARLWVRLWGRDPAFVETLQFTHYFRTRRWLAQRDDVDLVSLGEAIFEERMQQMALKEWGGLGRVRRALEVADRLHLVPLVTWLCLRTKSFDPIVLTLRKRRLAVPEPPLDNQQIYDTHWPQWSDMKRYGPSSRWLRALIGDLVDERLRGAAIERVLDFGCGEGSNTEYLARKLPAARVLGIDQSGSGIDSAKSTYGAANLEFRHEPGDIVFGGARFDLITCFEVLEHVEDWQALARRLAGATSRYLLVSFPTGKMRGFEVNVGHLRNFKPGDFESFMERLGFRAVKLYYAGFPFYSPVFRDLCELTNSGGNALTTGRYSFWQRRLSDLIFVSFRYLSTRKRGGDQFCGLFELAAPGAPVAPVELG
jgi:2-polyprenyl-3-methyl-5-hydroxy-6-metoxy-1,4-benzoquinol methylase